jgi:hypothetical protein
MDITNTDYAEIAYRWEALSLKHNTRKGNELNVDNGVAVLSFSFETYYEALSLKIESDESEPDGFSEATFALRNVPTPVEAYRALFNNADDQTFVRRNLDFILDEFENFLSLFRGPRFIAS